MQNQDILKNFVRKLFGEANITNENQVELEQQIEETTERLEETILQAVLDVLPEKEFNEVYEAVESDNYDANLLKNAIESAKLDWETVLNDILIDFRAKFLEEKR